MQQNRRGAKTRYADLWSSACWAARHQRPAATRGRPHTLLWTLPVTLSRWRSLWATNEYRHMDSRYILSALLHTICIVLNYYSFCAGEVQLVGKTVKTPRLQAWMSDPVGKGASLYQKSEPIPWTPEMLQVRLFISGVVCVCVCSSALAFFSFIPMLTITPLRFFVVETIDYSHITHHTHTYR